MKHILSLSLIFFFTSPLLADNSDPNNYFKDRTWTVDAGKSGTLHISSTYAAEPVHLPNHLKIELQCPDHGSKRNPKSSKKLSVVKKFKYCGIDAVTVIGGKVELMLTEFNPADSRGYCTVRKKKYLPLPKCN